MNTRRLAMAGLAVFASVALGTAGCSSTSSGKAGGAGSSAPAASASSASPTDTVMAAVKKLSDGPYKYTITANGLSGHGAVDPTAKKVQLTLSGKQSGVNIAMDIVLISPDYWMKADFGGQNAVLGLPPSTKWMHIDPTKIKNSSAFVLDPSQTDPTRSSGLFKGMTDAKKIDATHYTVTIDTTKTTDDVVDSATQTKLGDKAKAVPVQVVLDDQGRLASVSMDLTSVDPDSSFTTTFSDYGTPAGIDKPAASDTVEAPASVYSIFNS